MKIYAISDLHLEFYPDHEDLMKILKPILPKADILLLAGDIGDPITKSDSYKALLTEFKTMYTHVILIAGNHEYYKCNLEMDLTRKSIKKICEEIGVVFLDNQTVIIDGIKFIGTTLWSKGDLYIDKCVNDIGKVFKNVEDHNKEFQRCFEWLKNELANKEDNKDNNDAKEERCFKTTVVITHHLPTKLLCNSRYDEYGVMNTAFYTEILNQLNLSDVSLWICGHTHESKIYLHPKNAEKRILKFIVNPLGYPKETRVTKTLRDTHTIL